MRFGSPHYTWAPVFAWLPIDINGQNVWLERVWRMTRPDYSGGRWEAFAFWNDGVAPQPRKTDEASA